MDYQKQASDFLAKYNLEFRAVLVGDDCPRFCEDAAKDRDMDKVNTFPRKTHIHGEHYRCTISGKGRGHISFDFWNSYADEEYNALGSPAHRRGETSKKYGFQNPKIKANYSEAFFDNGKPKTPKPYDLLACITKNAPGHFEEFCSDYGYDTDSRKAEDTWKAVMEEWRKVSRFFTSEEMNELQEIS